VQYFSFAGDEVEVYHISEVGENKTLPVPPTTKPINMTDVSPLQSNHTIDIPVNVNNGSNVSVGVNVSSKPVSFKPVEVKELNVSDRRCIYDWDSQFKLLNLSYGKIVFSAFGDSQIGVGISPILGISPNMYKIMIGGANNASYITHEDHTVCTSNNTYIPKHVLKNYTVIVNRLEKTIEVTQDGHEILYCHDNDFVDNVQYVTFNKQNIHVFYSNYGAFALPAPVIVVPTTNVTVVTNTTVSNKVAQPTNVTVVTNTTVSNKVAQPTNVVVTVSNKSVVVAQNVKTAVVTLPTKTTVSTITVVPTPPAKTESQDFSIPDS